MKTATKFVVYGGIAGGVATSVLGSSLMAAVIVSVATGTGTFTGITVRDGLPALTEGFQQYEGRSGGIFGERPPPAPPVPAR